jgi:hypothetical protein
LADPREVGGFRLTAQAAAFLAIIGVLAAALAFASPLAAVVLGALGVMLVPVLVVRAALRARSAGKFSLTPAEGAVGLSVGVMGIAGAAVTIHLALGIGLRGEVFFPGVSWPSPQIAELSETRSVNYPDTRKQRRLKDALTRAGIPFTVRTDEEGKEWITWMIEDDPAARAIEKKAR